MSEQYIANLSDSDLIKGAKVCNDDLQKAANEQSESEWHEACFAAMVMFSRELGKRGLKIQSVH